MQDEILKEKKPHTHSHKQTNRSKAVQFSVEHRNIESNIIQSSSIKEKKIEHIAQLTQNKAQLLLNLVRFRPKMVKTAYDADICMIDTDLQFNVQCKCESILMNLSESFESLIFGFHVNFSPKNFNQFSTKTISMKLRAYGLRFPIFKAYSAFSLLKIPTKLINGSLKAEMN